MHDRQLPLLWTGGATCNRSRCRIAATPITVLLLLERRAHLLKWQDGTFLRTRLHRSLLDDPVASRSAARQLRPTEFSDDQFRGGIRLYTQLAPEQRNNPLIMLDRFGLASGGRQCMYDEPVGVLAETVDSHGARGSIQRFIRVPEREFELPQSH